MSDLAIDHVILTVSDLDEAAIRLWERHGLTSVPGGEHPGFGTGNRIVPLGGSYIELLGITDPEVALRNHYGQRVAEEADAGDRLTGWAIRTDDIDAIAARLDLTILPGARTKPDGSVISWRFAGIEVALEEPWLPFFLSWDDGVTHPSSETATHINGAGGITWIEVGGDATRLKEWVGDLDGLPVRTGGRDPRVCAMGIGTSDGEIVLR